MLNEWALSGAKIAGLNVRAFLFDPAFLTSIDSENARAVSPAVLIGNGAR